MVVQEALETNVHVLGVGVVVDAHDEHRGVLSLAGAEMTTFFAPPSMCAEAFSVVGEHAGGLDDVLSAALSSTGISAGFLAAVTRDLPCR